MDRSPRAASPSHVESFSSAVDIPLQPLMDKYKEDDTKKKLVLHLSSSLGRLTIDSVEAIESVPQQYIRLPRTQPSADKSADEKRTFDLHTCPDKSLEKATADDDSREHKTAQVAEKSDDGKSVVETDSTTLVVTLVSDNTPPAAQNTDYKERRSQFKLLSALRRLASKTGASAFDLAEFDPSIITKEKVANMESAISKFASMVFGDFVSLNAGTPTVDALARKCWTEAVEKESKARALLQPLRDQATSKPEWCDAVVPRNVDFAVAEKLFQDKKVEVFSWSPVPDLMTQLEVIATNQAVWAAAHGSARSLLKDQQDVMNTKLKYHLRAMTYDASINLDKFVLAWCDRSQSHVMLGFVPLGKDPTGKFDLGVTVRELFYMPNRHNPIRGESKHVSKTRGREMIRQFHRPGTLGLFCEPEVTDNAVKFAFRTIDTLTFTS